MILLCVLSCFQRSESVHLSRHAIGAIFQMCLLIGVGCPAHNFSKEISNIISPFVPLCYSDHGKKIKNSQLHALILYLGFVGAQKCKFRAESGGKLHRSCERGGCSVPAQMIATWEWGDARMTSSFSLFPHATAPPTTRQ